MFTKIKMNFNFLKQWKLSFNNFVNRNGYKFAVSRKKAKVLKRLRRNPPGSRVIFISVGQKSSTRII